MRPSRAARLNDHIHEVVRLCKGSPLPSVYSETIGILEGVLVTATIYKLDGIRERCAKLIRDVETDRERTIYAVAQETITHDDQ